MTTILQLHNSTQSVPPVKPYYDNKDSVSVAYDSVDTFQDHLLYSIQQQASVFAAMSLVSDINRLNGRKVVSDYMVNKIKHYYRNPFPKNQNRKNQNHRNQKQISLKGNENTENKTIESQKDFQKEYQKAYMKMLSV